MDNCTKGGKNMTKEERIVLKNMQKLREQKKITQVKLSLMVGISQQSITYYETNTRIPSLPVAVKIAKALGTSIEGLMDENDITAKYYSLPKSDRETIDKMIETLYQKNNS